MSKGQLMIPSTILTAVFVITMLIAQKNNRGDLAAVCKMLASCGFLLTAWRAGAFHSTYGAAIFIGLALSWFGDLFLIYESKPAFLAGLVAFLFAHLAYCAAFTLRGIAWSYSAASLIILVPFIAIVLWWLLPHVHGPMRGPVLAYSLVITAMVALATGMLRQPSGTVILLGAIAFYLSDLFVARGRFVHADAWNGLIGLPLYYAGQLLLALSIYPAKL